LFFHFHQSAGSLASSIIQLIFGSERDWGIMAPKQGKMARQEAGASGKPAKVRNISDQKAAMMLVSCKEERYAQHHLEEKQLVSSRVGEDASLASAFAAWIMKNDKKKMLEENFTRNARDTKSTGFRVVRQIIMLCFEFGAEGVKTLNNVNLMELYKLATNWQDGTEIPVREGSIKVFVFCVSVHIMSQTNYGDLFARVRRLKRIDFSHSLGRFQFAGLTPEGEYTGVVHKSSGIFKTFEFDMKIRGALTNDFSSKAAASCHLMGNGSSYSTILVRHVPSTGTVVGQYTISHMFDESLFEEAFDNCSVL